MKNDIVLIGIILIGSVFRFFVFCVLDRYLSYIKLDDYDKYYALFLYIDFYLGW